MTSLAAAVLALMAGATFALSAVLQQRAARTVAPAEGLSFRLFRNLVRRRVWLAGTVTLVAGFALQAGALAVGTVSLVAPLIVTELVFALPLAAQTERRRPGRRDWIGAVAVLFGVGTFLVAASPHGGHPDPAGGPWMYMLLPCAAIVTVCVLAARSLPATGDSPRRATLLAVAAGITFGLLSVFTKSVTWLMGTRGIGFLLTWQPYGLLVIGGLGFLFSQSAYQAASLRRSLPVIDALEPTVAVILAAGVFGEHLAHGPGAVTAQLLGAALALIGVFLVGRSPMVLRMYDTSPQP